MALANIWLRDKIFNHSVLFPGNAMQGPAIPASMPEYGTKILFKLVNIFIFVTGTSFF